MWPPEVRRPALRHGWPRRRQRRHRQRPPRRPAAAQGTNPRAVPIASQVPNEQSHMSCVDGGVTRQTFKHRSRGIFRATGLAESWAPQKPPRPESPGSPPLRRRPRRPRRRGAVRRLPGPERCESLWASLPVPAARQRDGSVMTCPCRNDSGRLAPMSTRKGHCFYASLFPALQQ